jgi:hypothetical protein
MWGTLARSPSRKVFRSAGGAPLKKAYRVSGGYSSPPAILLERHRRGTEQFGSRAADSAIINNGKTKESM